MAVDPIYRRQGVARATMNFLIGQLAHVVRLELVTQPENDHALRLYASLGFKIGTEISNYFGDGEPRGTRAIGGGGGRLSSDMREP